jgi:hypothetical protein
VCISVSPTPSSVTCCSTHTTSVSSAQLHSAGSTIHEAPQCAVCTSTYLSQHRTAQHPQPRR